MEQIYPRGAPNIPPGALQAAQLAQYTSINGLYKSFSL